MTTPNDKNLRGKLESITGLFHSPSCYSERYADQPCNCENGEKIAELETLVSQYTQEARLEELKSGYVTWDGEKVLARTKITGKWQTMDERIAQIEAELSSTPGEEG